MTRIRWNRSACATWLVAPLLALAWVEDAAVAAVQPPEVQQAPAPLPPALGAAYGVPPSGGEVDPMTTAQPGFAERGGTQAADKVYGPAGSSDGTESSGFEIYQDDAYIEESGGALEAPDYHMVNKGDTLWSISRRYLEDSYQWPKLWSYNEHITNAHWIFPGDRIRLFDPYGRSDDRLDAGQPRLRYSKTRFPVSDRRDAYLLNQVVYVAADEFKSAMEVIGGGDAGVMMATLDTVYMSYDKSNPPVTGERLMVYAPQSEVRDLKNRETLGWVVQVVGEVEVGRVARKAAEGTLALTLNPVERGYKVGPLRRSFRRVEPVEAERAEVGRIVAVLTSTVGTEHLDSEKRRRKRTFPLAGEGDLVVLDLGADAGLRAGNELEVVRKGDEYTKKRVFHMPYEDGWPRRVVGRVLVIDVDSKTSLGVVVKSLRELERGDHVELRPPGMDPDALQPTTRASSNASGSAAVERDERGASGSADARVRLGGDK